MLEILVWAEGNVLEGWTGPAALTASGLLAAVLAWLGGKYLPAKDAQIRELLEMAVKDREGDRGIRHEMASTLTKAISEVVLQHKEDAIKDRQAFMERNDKVVAALAVQTAELKAEFRAMLGQVCRAAIAESRS